MAGWDTHHGGCARRTSFSPAAGSDLISCSAGRTTSRRSGEGSRCSSNGLRGDKWARHASTGRRGGVVVRGRSCGGRGAVVVERMECGDCEHDGPAERPGPGLIGCIMGRTLDNGRAQSSKGVFAANASPDLPSWPAAGPAAALALLSLAYSHLPESPRSKSAISRQPAATTPTSTGSFESSPPGEASPGWGEVCFAHPASRRLPGHISPRGIALLPGPGALIGLSCPGSCT